MSDACQIECYAEVSPEGVGPLLERARITLEQLTGDLLAAGELVAGFPDDRPINADLIHPRPPRPRFRLKAPEPRLVLEPALLGWTPRTVGRHARPRLELSLVLDPAEVFDAGGVYRPAAARSVWRVVDTMARAFATPVFVTGDENEGRAFQAWAAGRGTVFDFDLACFPGSAGLADHDPPFDYEIHRLAEVDAALRTARWERPPWP